MGVLLVQIAAIQTRARGINPGHHLRPQRENRLIPNL
jgi:hypothetical protein